MDHGCGGVELGDPSAQKMDLDIDDGVEHRIVVTVAQFGLLGIRYRDQGQCVDGTRYHVERDVDVFHAQGRIIDPYQGKMAALFAKEQGASKIAIIYAKDDDYSNGLKDAFVENADSNGLEIVYTGECTTTDTDFTAQASQAVAAGADFLFYPCFLDTVPLLVQQARDAGFEGITMGGDGWDGSDTR